MRKAGGLAGVGEGGEGGHSLPTKFNSLPTKFNSLPTKFNSLPTKFNSPPTKLRIAVL